MTFESAFFDEDVMLPALAGALWPASAGSLHFPRFWAGSARIFLFEFFIINALHISPYRIYSDFNNSFDSSQR